MMMLMMMIYDIMMIIPLSHGVVFCPSELHWGYLLRCTEVFKQHKCGSIVHAHWQIITTPFVPSSVDVGYSVPARYVNSHNSQWHRVSLAASSHQSNQDVHRQGIGEHAHPPVNSPRHQLANMPLFICSQLVIEQYLWKVQLIRAARLHKRFGVCVGCQVLVSAPTGAPRLESSTASMFSKTVMDTLSGKDS